MTSDTDNSTQLFDVSAVLRDQGGEGQSGAQLIVVEGKDLGHRMALARPHTTIGRREGSHFVLDSHTVSRDHACVIREGEHYHIVDVGSSNGVYINGRRIPPLQRRRLTHGDSLRLGEVLLLFQHQERFVNSSGLSNIVIDRERVMKEVDSFFEQLRAWRGSDRDGPGSSA